MATLSGGIEYACLRFVIAQPVAVVWQVAGQFGGVDRWVDGVTACSLECDGPGAVRTLVRGGATVRERLESCEADSHTLTYAILEPHSLPASDVRSVLSLWALDTSTTEIVWRSQARDFLAPPTLLGARIEDFYTASLENLARLLGG